LDPKLSFKKQLEIISSSVLNKINIFKRIKGFKWNNGKKLSIIIYKSLIRSIFEYCHTICKCGTQRLSGFLQKMQNRILRTIKWFPFKTSTNQIHEYFSLKPIDLRLTSLFNNFMKKRSNHPVLQNEISNYPEMPTTVFPTPSITLSQTSIDYFALFKKIKVLKLLMY